MPEFLTNASRQPSDPALDGVDDAALEALLNSYDPSNPDKPIEVPVADAPPEPPVEAAPPVEEAPPAEAPPEEPEIDLAASEKEGDRIAREKLEAALALQQAHSSRLAGEIGYLKQKLESNPRSSEPYQPETQAELDRLTSLEQRLADSENRRIKTEVSQAIESELNSLDGAWSKELATEIAAVAPKYADQIKAARESTDPALARQISKAVGLLVRAEAMQMSWDTKHKALVEKKAATVSAATSAKKAATISGSGAVPTPPPQPKSFADMTADEADAWLKANVR